MTTALRVANCERLSRLPAHLDALCTAPRAPRQTDFCYPRATSVFDHLADDVVPRESIKVEKPLEVCIDLKTANSTLVHNASGKHFPSNEIPVADIGTTAFTASLTDSPKSRQVLVIVVRADPVICGHSTEARNLAEAALLRGYEPIIVTWHEDILAISTLPLKPQHEIEPYSAGITVLRPSAVGNYKLLDGRYNMGMVAAIVDIARSDPSMKMTLMCLYLQPHAQICLDAVDAIRGAWGDNFDITTVAEAVGSDVTNILSNALKDGNFGAAISVLSQFLRFDVPVCVSQFTLDEVLRHAAEVDAILRTTFAPQLQAKCSLSYPALDIRAYTELDPLTTAEVLKVRGLVSKQYVLYLSRVIEAKGIFELVEGFQTSRLPAAGYTLLVVGRGEALAELQALTEGMSNIQLITDLADAEKAAIFDGAAAYALPSKYHPTFVETFGIVITEAMLTNCGPVITCRTGGIPEAAGSHCFYADVNSAPSLAVCLEDAVLNISAADKAAMLEGARQHALQFDRKNIWQKLEAKVVAARNAKAKAKVID